MTNLSLNISMLDHLVPNGGGSLLNMFNSWGIHPVIFKLGAPSVTRCGIDDIDDHDGNDFS